MAANGKGERTFPCAAAQARCAWSADRGWLASAQAFAGDGRRKVRLPGSIESKPKPTARGRLRRQAVLFGTPPTLLSDPSERMAAKTSRAALRARATRMPLNLAPAARGRGSCLAPDECRRAHPSILAFRAAGQPGRRRDPQVASLIGGVDPCEDPPAPASAAVVRMIS